MKIKTTKVNRLSNISNNSLKSIFHFLVLIISMIMVWGQVSYVNAEDYEVKYSGDYCYVDYEDGVWIVACGTYHEGDETFVVTYPDVLDGKKVIGIGEFPEVLDGVWTSFPWDAKGIVLPPHLKYLSSGVITSNISEITLPSSLIKICNNAFEYSSIKKVSIPENVEFIGSKAFYRCAYLEEISIPDDIKEIYDYTFFECKSIKNIDLPSKLESIGDHAFDKCYSIEKITIPDSVKTIGEYSFADCRSLIEYEVGENNTQYYSYNGLLCKKNQFVYKSEIDGDYDAEDAYTKIPVKYVIQYPCGRIGDFCIEEDMKLKDNVVLMNAIGLTEISVESDNMFYSSEDGVLFNKDKSVLMMMPCAKTGEYTIPSTVTTVDYSAFSNSKLTKIVIPDSVKEVGRYAFYQCLKLESINIGKGLNRLSSLDTCTSLKEITVSQDNNDYTAIDNVIYDKKIESLELCPRGYIGKLTIPDTVNDFSLNAFESQDLDDKNYRCDGITELHLGADFNSAIDMDDDYSNNLYVSFNLKNVTVSENNKYYKALDGVLYSKDMKELIMIPSKKEEVIIPEGVEKIIDGCFSSTYMRIEKEDGTVQSAFNKLTCITIPQSVKTICNDLYPSKIKGYTGSVAEEYAKKNNIKFEAIGIIENQESNDDPNGTQKVNDSSSSDGNNSNNDIGENPNPDNSDGEKEDNTQVQPDIGDNKPTSQQNDTDLFANNKIKKRTVQEIEDYLSKHLWSESELSYDITPVTSSPFNIGKVSDKSLNAGLNALNIVRFVAGLDEVSISDEYNELAQAAALVNAINCDLSHYPVQPDGMSDDLYELGKKGAGSSNIGMGYTNLGQSVIFGYMDDSNPNNRDKVGHRRCCLYPKMKETGFGFAENGTYCTTAMYSADTGANVESSEYMVAWPATVMPVWLFSGDLWSFSKSSAFSEDTIVTVTRKADQKKWVIDKSSKDGYFSINNNGYGQPGCVIFSPKDINIKGDDIYSIKIVDGDFCKTYDVEFYCKHSYIERITKNATCTEKGEKEYSCSECGKSYTEEIPAIGHDYTENIIAPTNTSKGYTLHECKNCGYSFKDNFVEELQETNNNPKTDESNTTTNSQADNEKITLSAMTVTKATPSTDRVRFSWDADSNATGFIIEYSTKADLSDRERGTWDKNFFGSYLLGDLAENTTYYYRLRSFKGDGDAREYSEWTTVASVTTKAKTVTTESNSNTTSTTVKAPKIKIKSFKNNKKGKAVVKWKWNVNADGYQVSVSKKKSFSGAKKKNVNAYTDSIAVSGLKKGKTYYAKVRSYVKDDYGKKVYGKWSAIKKVKIKK